VVEDFSWGEGDIVFLEDLLEVADSGLEVKDIAIYISQYSKYPSLNLINISSTRSSIASCHFHPFDLMPS